MTWSPTEKKIAISLVVYNELKHIPKLTDSILAQTEGALNIYAFDNASKDGSGAELRKRLGEITLTTSGENLGYAAGHNHNARLAFEDGADVLVILNTDVELDEDFLQVLKRSLNEESGTGVFAPLIFYGNSTGRSHLVQMFNVEVNFSLWGKDNHRRLLEVSDLDDWPETCSTDLVSGAAFVLIKEVFDRVGLFDERHFLYGEEMDFCYKAKCAGIGMLALRDAKVWHYHDWSADNQNGFKREYFYINRNRIYFFKKHHFKLGLVSYLVKEFVLSPYKVLWCCRKGGWGLVYHYYLGIIKGLQGKTGRADLLF